MPERAQRRHDLASSDARNAGWGGATGGGSGNGGANKAVATGGAFVVTLNSGTTTITGNYRAEASGTATFNSSSVSVLVF